MFETLLSVAWQCWLVLGDMAPYLLLGFLVAGLLSAWIPPQWVERQLGHRGFGPVLKASLFGVPLPLCSCGVIPVAASIRRHGASRAATTSFLLSTPQTGVDSIAITYALLGLPFAVFRPVAALLTGLLGGALVQVFGPRDDPHVAGQAAAPACTEPCCTDRDTRHAAARALHYGFVVLPRDIGVALLAGVLIAGLISALVPEPPKQLQWYLGGGILSMLLMIAVGIPIYVCASASVPIAAGFIHLGASPGAALAFLIAGPATNAATITTLWRLLGRRTALLYLLTIALAALGCGLLLDGLFAVLQATPLQADVHHHHMAAEGGWLPHAWAVALLAVLATSYWSPWSRASKSSRAAASPKSVPSGAGQSTASVEAVAHNGRQRVELTIRGMTCSHCTAGAGKALAACAGVESADVTLNPGHAVVSGIHLDPDQLVAAVSAAGFSATVVD